MHKISAAQVLHTLLVKCAAKDDEDEEREARGSEIIPRGGISTVGDVLFPMGSGGRRAGRAAELADAMGKDVPFSVKYPIISSILGSIGGGVLGGAGGALLGAGAGGTLGAIAGREGVAGGIAAGAPAGAILGTLLGSLGGAIGTGVHRHRRVRDIADAYDSDVDGGRTGEHRDTPEKRYGALGKLLLPFSGQWNAGTAEARLARKKRVRPSYAVSQGLSDSGSIAAVAGLPVAPLLSLAGGYGGHISAGQDARQANE